ncbi:MAG: hypothetical protein Q9220_003509 [cf. Caloplaca sp. 1 TL-2023]
MAAIIQPQEPTPIEKPPIEAPQITENGSINNTHDLHTSAASLSTAENATVDGSTNPAKTPFINPSSASQIPAAPSLTPDQTAKYTKLLETVTSWTTKPTNPPTPLTDTDRIFLTRECLLRYLRATKWSPADASTRLLATLTWRHEYALESHTPEYISPENATGKQVLTGYDIAGRPCLYLNPGKQNTERSNKQVEHLVYMLERTIDLMPPGQETLSLLINFDKKTGGGERPPLWQGKQVLNILQSHYPERLGRALVINSEYFSIHPVAGLYITQSHPRKRPVALTHPLPKLVPWVVWTFFKLINPFIDPATREKLKFDQDLRQFVPAAQLLKTFGGDVDFVYEHETYWPALNKLAEQKRERMMERWIRNGRRLGESEFYLRGGEVEGKKVNGHV